MTSTKGGGSPVKIIEDGGSDKSPAGRSSLPMHVNELKFQHEYSSIVDKLMVQISK